MVQKFLFKFENDECFIDGYFDECNLKHASNYDFELENSHLIVEAFLYFEAVQEIIIGKAISIKNKNKYTQSQKTKIIQSLVKLQKEIQDFQKCFLLVLFKDIFYACDEIEKNSQFDDLNAAIEKLWDIVTDLESNENKLFSKEEVSTLKAYFDSSDLDILSKNLKGNWADIIQEYKDILVGLEK